MAASTSSSLGAPAPGPSASPTVTHSWFKDADQIRSKTVLIVRELDRILAELGRHPEHDKLPEIIQRYQTLLLLYRDLLTALKKTSMNVYLGAPSHVDVNMIDILPNRDLRTKYTNPTLSDLETKHKTSAIAAHSDIKAYNSLDQNSVTKAFNSWKGCIEAHDRKIVGARRATRNISAQMNWRQRIPREEEEVEEDDPQISRTKLEGMLKWVSSGPDFTDIDKVLASSSD
ncbi:hypothetical protein SmJEL517_g05429 [Synchytrium microbalum]|uniref:Mediator complex subunit 8 n=1 Tax=Synchytrium microbalum TaxID=1806994 RepID=A0A507BZN6_9FUNG|nr:uncharacterized protein SmJEL517_g05429 [Synchytrium microbalum]TPX31206.1 hypothetical protein SmJEL517_g05429 [Synchytrium microbalum]